MKDWKEFYKENPSATLKDYAAYCSEEETKRKVNNLNAMNYYDTLVGKYFWLNYNGTSFAVFHYNLKDENYQTKYLFYDYAEYNGGVKVCREFRYVNKCWFENPYLECQNTGVYDCKEITKEQYDEIVKMCDNALHNISCKIKTI